VLREVEWLQHQYTGPISPNVVVKVVTSTFPAK
jgi:hypothetical protein